MSAPSAGSVPPAASVAIGGEENLRLLTQLVSIAPTNLEDIGHGQWEKPNYLRAADAIARAARAAGLSTRIYDPTVVGDVKGDWHGAPRPNVIAELDVGASETVLILAHLDVVPVPAEQLGRWKSPPHTLTLRSDGRLYGRGASDDLGSGVVASIAALRKLSEETDLRRNVRLIVCCDEETGGEGGVEAIKAHDALLPPNDPERILRGDVALIPDGSPEATAGSSGVAFLEASFQGPVSLTEGLAYGQALVDLHEVARTWRSVYASPDWPDRHAPEPVITGRASVTRFDLVNVAADGHAVRLVGAHAETDAANQSAAAVTLLFQGDAKLLGALPAALAPFVGPPFRLQPAAPHLSRFLPKPSVFKSSARRLTVAIPTAATIPCRRRCVSCAPRSTGSFSTAVRSAPLPSPSTFALFPKWNFRTGSMRPCDTSAPTPRTTRRPPASSRRPNGAGPATTYRSTTPRSFGSSGFSTIRWAQAESAASTGGPTQAPSEISPPRKETRCPPSSSAAWTRTPISTTLRRARTPR